MKPRGNIYLTGFMGAGKSAVGKALARRLGWGFVDLDSRIERRAGFCVSEIFERMGEARFRRLEEGALRRICRSRGLVVALGGGALLKPQNRRAVRGSGLLVSLSCAEPELWRRLKAGLGQRPLLKGPGARERLRRLLSRRKNLYARADLSVSTTRKNPAQAAALIARRLEA